MSTTPGLVSLGTAVARVVRCGNVTQTLVAMAGAVLTPGVR